MALSGKLWFVSNGHLKIGQLWAIPPGNTYKGSPAPDGYHFAGSSLGSWWPSGE